MVKEITADELASHSKDATIVDVRSPNEYHQGHIPGAINLPLFSDGERELIGTIYHHHGRDEAFNKGLELAGSKLSAYIREIRNCAVNDKLLVYCWRGGMRSESLSRLFSVSGFNVGRLTGGYKAFRKYAKQFFDCRFRFIVIGGMTGTGKTGLLKQIGKSGRQVIDLEATANHKGSVFGHLGQSAQPTNEQFENELFFRLNKMDKELPVWIEDESRNIGSNMMPLNLFDNILCSPLILLELSIDKRIIRLVNEYAGYDTPELLKPLSKISKRLGSLNTGLAREAIINNEFGRAADIILHHYDKTYSFSVNKRNPETVFRLALENDDAAGNAALVLELARQKGILNFEF
jgi:tRNA 2-selenouridine synthase